MCFEAVRVISQAPGTFQRVGTNRIKRLEGCITGEDFQQLL